VISRGETVAREPGANNEIVRQRIRAAIQQTLSSKGLRQVSDPQAADFLVDYRVAVRRHDVTVQRVYPGGYPGLRLRPLWMLGIVGRRPPEVSYENIRFREGTVVLTCEAIDEAAGVSRDWSKAGRPRYVQSGRDP